jgi:hypothetical protein
MKIFDAHVNLEPVLHLAGQEASTLVPFGNRKQLIAALDRYGIDKAVVYGSRLAGQDAYDLNYTLANRAVADAVQADPDRLVGFARIYPSGFVDCTNEIIRCRDEYGFKGLHLNGDWEFSAIGATQMEPYLGLCQAWGWPVVFHTGTYPLNQPGLLIPVARKFPRLNLIASHLGYDMIEDAIAAAMLCPNIYLETSATAMPNMIRDVIRRCGADKVLYGSGLPFAYPDQQQDSIKRLAGITAAEYEAIFGGTLRRLLKMN